MKRQILFHELPVRLTPIREFHIVREARQRYELDHSLFSVHGTAIFSDFEAAQRVAHKINEKRDVKRFPERAIRAGDLYAAGLIHEILHLVLITYRQQRGGFSPQLLEQLSGTVGQDALERTLQCFVEVFPASSVYRGEQTPEAYLDGSTDGTPHRFVALEEMLLLSLSNQNPAYEKFQELLDESKLKEATAYQSVIQGLEQHLDDEPGFEGSGGGSILRLLRAPALASPTSLSGQLEFIRSNWSPFLGDRFEVLLTRILKTLDVIKEEQKWGLAGPASEYPAPVLDANALKGEAFSRKPVEYERFSTDLSWMPRAVVLAKSTYVWLEQLSRQYGRAITRLDQIPDEELDELSRRGFTGLWLIGLWERSEASKRIKHIRGNPEAVASAYSLYDYAIAADLGGEGAYEDLRNRAWQRGIRLASDMVPNHMGIDSRWVIAHPDWFLQLDHSPYPGYTFSGPNLSPDDRVGIYLEDHYYDSTDAAVVFKRVDHQTGEERYIYHGNDGTSMPWNDTAQLNYLRADVREAVIQTILHVARKFPIIRFDAAMTLAKQHIQRLWFPEPGHGGAIPSRTQYGSMTAEEFDRAIPNEFWREVVDRVAQEVPDTLLLAEAFWMMEGYFVRTLGMHRVYNSAFMNMMKREANAEYRQLVKNVLEFDPQILKRFVNFMNNPDEETAVAQFGKDDKYFGVCILMSTMPGLPMFGHGQVEGYTEKYGMEYKRAKLDETPDQGLIERHRREVSPLLHRRAQFAEVDNFLLYDFYTPEGHVNEDVYAYSNRYGDQASLVTFNNKFGQAKGWINTSLPYSERTGNDDERRQTQRQLADGLGLRGGDRHFTIFREHISGLEFLRRSRDLAEQGLYVELDAFKYQVFLDFTEVQDNEFSHFAQLHDELQGRGVPSIMEEIEAFRLRPLHDALYDVINPRAIALLADAVERTGDDLLPDLTPRYEAFLDKAKEYGLTTEPAKTLEHFQDMVKALAQPQPDYTTDAVRLAHHWVMNERDYALLIAYAAVHHLGADEDSEEVEAVSSILFRQWRLAMAARKRFEALGFAPAEAEEMTDLLRLLVRYAHALIPTEDQDATATVDAVLSLLITDADAQRFLRVNEYEGVRWFNQEAYRMLTGGLLTAVMLEARARGEATENLVVIAEALDAAEARSGYNLEKLVASEAEEDAETLEPEANVEAETRDRPEEDAEPG